MKIWVIKHKGKDWWGNYVPNFELTIGTDTVYADYVFFRKKDAIKYLKAKNYSEYYEVIGKE